MPLHKIPFFLHLLEYIQTTNCNVIYNKYKCEEKNIYEQDMET